MFKFQDKTHAQVECPILARRQGVQTMYMFIVPTDYVLFLRIMKLKTLNPVAWQKFMKLNQNPDKVQLTSLSPFHTEVNRELILFLKDTMGTLNSKDQARLIRLCGTVDLFCKDHNIQESQVNIKEIDDVLDVMDWNSLDDETPHYEDKWMT